MTTEQRLTALEQGNVQTRGILESMGSRLRLLAETLLAMRQDNRQDNEAIIGLLREISRKAGR